MLAAVTRRSPHRPIAADRRSHPGPAGRQRDPDGHQPRRQFEADRGGAEISGDPAALASALDKIHRDAQGIPLHAAEAHPTAQMMIMNPLSAADCADCSRPTRPPRSGLRLMEMARRT